MGGFSVSRSDVQGNPTKSTTVDTPPITVRIRGKEVAEISIVGEHIRLGEFTRIQGLIPPRHRTIKTTFGPEHLFERPEVVAVPN